MEAKIKEALEEISRKMKLEDTFAKESIANIWQLNIAMMFHNEMIFEEGHNNNYESYKVAAEIARRFMKSYFDVETRS